MILILSYSLTKIILWNLNSVGCRLQACIPSCFSRVQLCDPMDNNVLGTSVHGTILARLLKIPPRNLPDPKIESVSCVSCIASGFFTSEPIGKPGLQITMCFFW